MWMGHETKTRARNESERIEREKRETTNYVSRSEGAENKVTPRTKKKIGNDRDCIRAVERKRRKQGRAQEREEW